MTLTFKKLLNRTFVHSCIVVFSLLTNVQAMAATLALAEAPLVSATTTQVLPNLMYILDNSGSMASEYMPDYVNDSNKCKGTGTSGEFNAACGFGDPPYNANQFNTLAYNPTITYSPPVESTGVERALMNSANTTGWTVVPNDAYGIFSTTNTSLIPNATNTVGYPDKVWCNTTIATAANLIDPLVCKKNGPQYIYPNNTGTTATSFNQPYTLRGHPYYYTVAPGEYCTNKTLTSCITATAPTATHTFPATLRWCNSSARTTCQAKYLDSTGYTFAKWSGVNNGTQSTGKIKINADTAGCGAAGLPVCSAPSAMNINDITVNGIRIIATPIPSNLNITDTTNSTSRNTLANNIRDAINNFVPGSGDDFIATSSGDEVTIRPTNVGPFAGTLDITASSVTRAAIGGVSAVGRIEITRAGKQARTTGSSSSDRCRTNAPENSINCPVTLTINQITAGSPSSSNIISGSVSYTTVGADSAANQTAFATLIKDKINSDITAPRDYTAICGAGTAGVGVACSTRIITITAAVQGVDWNGNITVNPTSGASANLTFTRAALAGGANGISARTYTIPTLITQFAGGTPVVNTFNRIDIEPSTLSYPKALTRTDCASSTCTYSEEMTNFANWYAYYRNRMMMMKTSTSRAFKSIDTRYRVGFITINNASTFYLPIANFNSTQKSDWYAKLFSAGGGSGTPLRQSLSTVGRIFAGKKPVGTSDPVQYSCQQNFALLTTDGYWNGSGGKQIDGSTDIGNMDGGTTGRPQYEGPTASSNGLADAAKYYYDTDLRNTSQGNCTGALGTDVCEDNVFVSPTDNNVKQHMTTFTLGLGVDGEMTYTSDYRNASSGDYYDITQGTKDWPVPTNDSQRSVDDLWHAAVNGQGTYFSAQDPNQLNTSLSGALQAIGAKIGAGAAAATSTLNPVAGDNFAYVASYATVKWTGNLEAREINLTTGGVVEDATWCVESVKQGSCAAPSSIVSEDVSGATVAYCVTPGATTTTCPSPGILDGTNCKVEVASSCVGAMTDNVGASLSSRNILIKDGASNNLVNFNYANIPVSYKPFFENTWLSTNLSQWSALTTDQQAIAGGVNLVNFLRGETGFEDRSSNLLGAVDNRIFRFREATLGDALESTPLFIGAPKLNYTDPGYGQASIPGTFKASQLSRPGTVFIGTNSGMMHAFNALNGEERWAYIPSVLLPKMYKLADKNYATMHTNYVNGDAVVNDICTANCSDAATAVWKTILVGGLNGGGRGYYALDVTNPTALPTLLWEFTPSNDSDLGFTYGTPIITKKADGTWVVLVTSGYNNLPGSSAANAGKGFLYVLNANNGTIISKYSTGVGNAASPSGLAKISAYVNQPDKNNTALYVYGGDLEGNLWRFDINSAQSSTNPFNMAILKSSTGTLQPITVAPELTDVNGKRLILVGTGKYLEIPDLTDTSQQTLYAITDDSATTLNDPRSSSTMVSQTLLTSGATRSIQQPANPVSYATGRGWYIDLPDSGERQNIPAQLVFGTLLVPTIVPSNTVCSPGGYGWLNFLNYRTGAAVGANVVSSKTNAPIVGINVLYIAGKPKVSIVTADNPTPEFPAVQPTFGSNLSSFANRRMIWRELIDE